ncbi:MAG TPA: helix-turn-helix domain-containing protein [Candidatus Dormibacteraeota bacterium]|nr:helix-turn-helix domain-containing protein [Candidatus Dormibacteraeota bacterium]
MPASLRLLIVAVALILVVLSITPLRRRLPVVGDLPEGLDLAAWVGLVLLCLSALAGVRTAKSIQLSQSLARAALTLAGQTFDSALGPAASWVSAHEPGLTLITVGVAALAWAGVAARLGAVVRRSQEPQPRLGDWWVVKYNRRTRPPIQLRAAAVAGHVAFMDAGAAAQYVGVSRTTLYRWARAGRVPCTRDEGGLRFNSADLAAVRGRLHSSAGAGREGDLR